MTSKKIITTRRNSKGVYQCEVFKILGDTNRYRIFEMLANINEMSVTQIATLLKISVPLASQHLKILEQGKILNRSKQGQMVYYRLSKDNRVAQSISKEVI